MVESLVSVVRLFSYCFLRICIYVVVYLVNTLRTSALPLARSLRVLLLFIVRSCFSFIFFLLLISHLLLLFIFVVVVCDLLLFGGCDWEFCEKERERSA